MIRYGNRHETIMTFFTLHPFLPEAMTVASGLPCWYCADANRQSGSGHVLSEGRAG